MSRNIIGKLFWMFGLLLFTLLPCTSLQAKLIPGFYPGWKKYERRPAAPRQGNQSAVPVASGKTWTEPVTGMEFVWVPGGCFQMGSTDGGSDEKPVHEVCLDGFWMGKTEVTQGQWKKIMSNNPSKFTSLFKNTKNFPVEQVSWDDAQAFIRKLKSRNGTRFRLPTEAEWEYAARSGGKDQKYAGGSDLDALAWYSSNSVGKTHPVAQKRPNGLGLYDMSGNVYEWCQDWYDVDHYKNSSRNNPQGPSSGSNRVFRGGSWFYLAGRCRSAVRRKVWPDFRFYDLGFRLALSADQ